MKIGSFLFLFCLFINHPGNACRRQRVDDTAQPLELSETFAPAKGTLSAPDNRNPDEKINRREEHTKRTGYEDVIYGRGDPPTVKGDRGARAN